MKTATRPTGVILLTTCVLASCVQQPTETAEPTAWPTAPPVTVVVEVTPTPAAAPTGEPVAEPTIEPAVELVATTWRQAVDAMLAESGVSDDSQVCVDCHLATTPKMIEQWVKSRHATNGVDCLVCHGAGEADWDYVEHYGDAAIATNPTAGDCAVCHGTEYEEFARSKHSGLSMIFFASSFDRNVLEPTVATKHRCQECLNVGHFWPDHSVGECDACHPKHTFDVAVARNPYTCGECHIGPDHPHIEIWLESKHGNVFLSNPDNWQELGYEEADGEPPPFDAPTCTTCHIDATVSLPATHDVGARMAWETQSPWTIRTTKAWGGGPSWEAKRENMTSAWSRATLCGSLSLGG